MKSQSYREITDHVFGSRTELILRYLGENEGKADRRTLRNEMHSDYIDLTGSIRWLAFYGLLTENTEEESIKLTRKGYSILEMVIFRISKQQPRREQLVDMEHVFVIKLKETRPEEIIALPEGTYAIIESLSDDPEDREIEIRWLHWLYSDFYSNHKGNIPTIIFMGDDMRYGSKTRRQLQMAGWSAGLSHIIIS